MGVFNMAWTWTGWLPCKQEIFIDKYDSNNFFHSGRNAAEERFWRKYIHNDGSYGRDGIQGRWTYSWPSSRAWSGASSTIGDWPRGWSPVSQTTKVDGEDVTGWRDKDSTKEMKDNNKDNEDEEKNKTKDCCNVQKEDDKDDVKNETCCDCCNCQKLNGTNISKQRTAGELIRTPSRMTYPVA